VGRMGDPWVILVLTFACNRLASDLVQSNSHLSIPFALARLFQLPIILQNPTDRELLTVTANNTAVTEETRGKEGAFRNKPTQYVYRAKGGE
jgi:hypothetical protein